jgi:hypothetical protein
MRPFLRVILGVLSSVVLAPLLFVLFCCDLRSMPLGELIKIGSLLVCAVAIGIIAITGRTPKIFGMRPDIKSWQLDDIVLSHQLDLMLREAEVDTFKAVILGNGIERIKVEKSGDDINFFVTCRFKEDVKAMVRKGQLLLPRYSEIIFFKPTRFFGLDAGLLWVRIPIHARQSIHAFISSVLHDLFELQCTDRFSITNK